MSARDVFQDTKYVCAWNHSDYWTLSVYCFLQYGFIKVKFSLFVHNKRLTMVTYNNMKQEYIWINGYHYSVFQGKVKVAWAKALQYHNRRPGKRELPVAWGCVVKAADVLSKEVIHARDSQQDSYRFPHSVPK